MRVATSTACTFSKRHHFEVRPISWCSTVGRVDFQIGDHMSVIQCPITVKGGTLEVESPEHPDAVRFNPVLLEEPLRREIVAAVRRKIAAMDIVPAYLRIAQQHARNLYGTGG